MVDGGRHGPLAFACERVGVDEPHVVVEVVVVVVSG